MWFALYCYWPMLLYKPPRSDFVELAWLPKELSFTGLITQVLSTKGT